MNLGPRQQHVHPLREAYGIVFSIADSLLSSAQFWSRRDTGSCAVRTSLSWRIMNVILSFLNVANRRAREADVGAHALRSTALKAFFV